VSDPFLTPERGVAHGARRRRRAASPTTAREVRAHDVQMYRRLMAMDVVVQSLQVGDVVLIDVPEQGGEVEATVVRDIARTESTVHVTLRVGGNAEFVREWSLGEMVTVVRGP
jgi:hypothetical protein